MSVRVPAVNLLGEVGAGFAMSQARLGPGRIHHRMHMIGAVERALELLIARANSRTTFGTRLVDQGVIREWIANSRMEIDQAATGDRPRHPGPRSGWVTRPSWGGRQARRGLHGPAGENIVNCATDQFRSVRILVPVKRAGE